MDAGELATRRLALPVDAVLERALAMLRESNLVLVAPPGTGKTTRLPAAILAAGGPLAGASRTDEILVLQPRRIAARLAAARVALEMGERVGERVGYQIRFESERSRETRLLYCTQGVLVRRFQEDPTLRGVGTIILDEFHERQLDSDTCLALALHAQRSLGRDDLRLIVMSATLPSEALTRHCRAQLLELESPLHPIVTTYLPLPELPVARRVLRALQELSAEALQGHILVFLPGSREIRATREVCEGYAAHHGFEVHVLHGELSSAEQDQAIAPSKRRKLILSTNVAQTSITIEGVSAVIDSGLARSASHQAWSGLPRLRIAPIAASAAIQRTGRAGRTGPGRCIRLFSAQDFSARPFDEVPELHRSDLAELMLMLEAMGHKDATRLPWFDAPGADAMRAAKALLLALGAVDSEGLTTLGREMVLLPLHPRLARVVLRAAQLRCLPSAARCACLLGERLPRSQQHATTDASVDPLERYRSLRRDGAARIVLARIDRGANQILRTVEAMRRGPNSRSLADEARDVSQPLARAFLAGFPDRVALLRDDGSEQRNVVFAEGGSAVLSHSSVLRSAGLVVALAMEDVREPGTSRHRAQVEQGAAIEADWLFEDFLDNIEERERVRFDEVRERVESEWQLCWGQLVLSTEVRPGDSAQIHAALAHSIRSSPLARLQRDPAKLHQLLRRLALLSTHGVLSRTPSESLLRELLVNASEGLRSLSQVRELEVESLLLEHCGINLHKLDTWAPSQLKVHPASRPLKIIYEDHPMLQLSHGAQVQSAELRQDEPRSALGDEDDEDDDRNFDQGEGLDPQGPPAVDASALGSGRDPWIGGRIQDFFGGTKTPTLLDGRVALVLHLRAPNDRDVQVTRDLAGFWQKHYPALRRELMRRYPRHDWPLDPVTATPPAPRPPRPRRK